MAANRTVGVDRLRITTIRAHPGRLELSGALELGICSSR
jgi:hypothetical protein